MCFSAGKKKRGDIDSGLSQSNQFADRAVRTLDPFAQPGAAAVNQLAAFSGLSGSGGSTTGGFNAQGYLDANPDVAAWATSLDRRQREFIQNAGYTATPEGVARYHYDYHGRSEGRSPSGAPVQSPANAQADAQADAENAFRESLFYTGGENAFNLEKDEIDSALSAQGLLYSQPRINAVEDARQRNFQNAFREFLGNTTNVASVGAGAAGGQANILTNQGGNAFNAGLARSDTRKGFLDRINQISQIGANAGRAYGGFS